MSTANDRDEKIALAAVMLDGVDLSNKFMCVIKLCQFPILFVQDNLTEIMDVAKQLRLEEDDSQQSNGAAL